MGNVTSTEVSTPDAGTAHAKNTLPSALVVVGPSGVGKGTLINMLKDSSDKFGFSCSHTTRKPREGEQVSVFYPLIYEHTVFYSPFSFQRPFLTSVHLSLVPSFHTFSSLPLPLPPQDGIHYHFTDKETFEAEIAQGKFLEYAYVHNNIYGTSIAAVEAVAASGKCCILDIDVQGARQVRASGLPAIFVFIAPPSLDELEQRLRGRGTETEEQITTRLRNAKQEMTSLDEPGLYDYTLVNNDLTLCYRELQVIAARAVAGEVGNPSLASASAGIGGIGATDLGPTTSGSNASLKEPPSATVSLRGWLGDTGSPIALEAALAAVAASGSGNNSSSSSNTALGSALLSAGLSRWRGRVALVTGAGGAVGWGLSLALASSGLRVVAISRRKPQLEGLQEAVAASGVPLSDFLPVVCDLTKEAEVTALPRIVGRRWPGAGIDILINAVGTSSSSGSIASNVSLVEGTSAAWVEAVSACVLGTALVCREVVGDMKKRGEWGHIVHITCSSSSTTTASGMVGMQRVAVEASKTLTNELRKEAGVVSGGAMRVSCVATGTIHSSGSGGGGGGSFHEEENTHEEEKRKGEGEVGVSDVVAAVAFCLSAPPHVDVSDIVVHGTR